MTPDAARSALETLRDPARRAALETVLQTLATTQSPAPAAAAPAPIAVPLKPGSVGADLVVAVNRLTWGNYTPAWPDIVISLGAYGLFGFLYTLLTKFIPIVSMWEYREGEHAEGIERVGGAQMPVTMREETIG